MTNYHSIETIVQKNTKKTKKPTNNIKTDRGRRDLKPRNNAYFETVRKGLAVGYRRKRGSADNSWNARLYYRGAYYYMEPLLHAQLPIDTTQDTAFNVVAGLAEKWANRLMKEVDQVVSKTTNPCDISRRVSMSGIPNMEDIILLDGKDNKLNCHGEPRTPGYIKENAQTLDKHFIRGGNPFARILITDLKREDITEALNAITEGKTGKALTSAQSTWNRVRNRIRAALNYFYINQRKYMPSGVVVTNLAWVNFGGFKEEARPYYVDYRQRDFLLAGCPDLDIQNLILAALYTGARVSELKKLTVGDLDHQTQTLHFVRSKTARRNTALSDEGFYFFSDLAEYKESGEPLLTFRGKAWPLESTYYIKLAKEAIANANKAIREHNNKVADNPGRKIAPLPTHAPLHTLRHSHISQSLLDGMAPAMIAKNAGNSARIIETNYTKFLAKDVRDKMNNVKLIKKLPKPAPSIEQRNTIPNDEQYKAALDSVLNYTHKLPAIFTQHQPLYDHWRKLDKKTLERFVWSAPVKTLGWLFGTSDNAIRKWCRSEGVAMPPKGFWRKVQSNPRSYPKGKPTPK